MEDTLLEVTEVEIPETLVVEQARDKFAIMMTELKDQGESDEKIKSMITQEVTTDYGVRIVITTYFAPACFCGRNRVWPIKRLLCNVPMRRNCKYGVVLLYRFVQNFAKYLEIVRKNVTRGLAASLLMTHIAEKEGLKVK